MQKKLYPNIHAELARHGLTVTMLATYMGMTRQNVYYKLAGEINFSIKDMEAVQNFFKLKTGDSFSLDYLFKS
jgi:predicted transcriptional regulator